MAEQHPTFVLANQETAAAIVDAIVEASATWIEGYDEGNPGSTRLVRIHTPEGTMWVSPGRVYAP